MFVVFSHSVAEPAGFGFQDRLPGSLRQQGRQIFRDIRDEIRMQSHVFCYALLLFNVICHFIFCNSLIFPISYV
jgi:hypothetical protein